ncbi:MAG: 3'-5' exonuclease [Tenericutes bacterium]|jgi:DNA polymerase III alpha subunit (gram-positive type)|nr:3'-5' exonuclease [Mycoplasmatota bacterium]
MEKKLMFLDVETGGLDEMNDSLLTIGLVYWENGEIVNGTEILISLPDYKVCKRAMDINKIDLNLLRENGCSEVEAINKVNEYCKEHFGVEKVILAGHNVSFDIAFLRELFRRNNVNYDERFGHRSVDTSSILKYLYYKGAFKEDISSSDKAFEYFGIDFEEGKRHSALGDSEATAKLFNKLLKVKK